MVATAAASSMFFPVVSPSPNSVAKSSTKLGGHLGERSKSAFSGMRVKASAQAPPKINGTPVGLTADSIKNEEAASLPQPRTFINQLPDWSVLLAAITTIFVAAEKQWMMVEWKPKRADVLVDPFGLGRMVHDGLVFQENFSIRSYEIGADRTASIETLMNHFQETAINHVKSVGLLGDGLGTTREMCKKNLIWVVARMQVLINRYPTWGDVVQVDTWVSASGKNGMRRNWILRDHETGEILTKASSVWVMMNKNTRKISKIPDEVRGEIEPYFIEIAPALDDDGRKIGKLDESTSDHVQKGLTPGWNDLDANMHVNNVKYIGWIIEGVPKVILESHELSSMTLEYRRECGRDSVLQSLAAVSCTGAAGEWSSPPEKVECQHLLRLESGVEIVKGRTGWRPKNGRRLEEVVEVPA